MTHRQREPQLSPEATGTPISKRRKIAVLVPFALLLCGWFVLFAASGNVSRGPGGKGLDGDFAMLLGGASALSAGHNPYDPPTLYRSEYDLLSRQHLAVPPQAGYIRVGSPPLVLWALEPLRRVPFRAAALLWTLLLVAWAAASFVMPFGVSNRGRRVLVVATCLLMPPAVLAAYYGNVDFVVLLSICAGLALAERRPALAGVALCVALAKPQIGLPAACLVILFHSPARVRTGLGFAAGVGAAILISILVTGGAMQRAWLAALGGYSHSLTAQPEIASLPGVYIHLASRTVTTVLGAALLGIAVSATAWWWWRVGERRVPLRATAWLWVLWFLATPYAHFHDEIVLAIPAAALLGADCRDTFRPGNIVTMYSLLLGVVLFPAARFTTDLQSLALLPVLAAAISAAAAVPVDRGIGSLNVLSQRVRLLGRTDRVAAAHLEIEPRLRGTE